MKSSAIPLIFVPFVRIFFIHVCLMSLHVKHILFNNSKNYNISMKETVYCFKQQFGGQNEKLEIKSGH